MPYIFPSFKIWVQSNKEKKKLTFFSKSELSGEETRTYYFLLSFRRILLSFSLFAQDAFKEHIQTCAYLSI